MDKLDEIQIQGKVTMKALLLKQGFFLQNQMEQKL